MQDDVKKATILRAEGGRLHGRVSRTARKGRDAQTDQCDLTRQIDAAEKRG